MISDRKVRFEITRGTGFGASGCEHFRVLKPGDIAPDFELPDASGRTVKLSEILQRSRVLLYFYPADHSPVCTTQSCMFRDYRAELEAAGVQALGISPQSVGSKRRFSAHHGLGFPLLADADRAVARKYGATGFFGLPLPFGVRRVTYLIGKDGRILDVAAAELRLGAHRSLMERALAAAGRPESGGSA